jgi:hypothetical protein
MAPISKKTSETKQTVQVVEQPAVEPKQKKTKAKTVVQEQAVAQVVEQPAVEPKQKKTKAKTVVQEQAVAQVVEQPAVEQSTEAPVVQEKKKRASSKKQAKPVETSVEATEQSSEASESVESPHISLCWPISIRSPSTMSVFISDGAS